MNRVPKLRFPEFSGEWEEKRLGEVTEIIMGQSPSSLAYNLEFNGLPLIQGNADCRNRKTFPRVYTSEITKESKVGDIIMSVRAPAGTVAISNLDSCIGRGVCAIREKTENQNFIFQYLINYEEEWSKYSQGSTFDSINSNDVKGLEMIIPPLPEQQEIASFLTSVDSKIERLERKKELFLQYKKGMMQKIFSQELRFKDEFGGEYPEWEERSLGEFAEINPKNVELPQEFVYIDLESVENGRLKKENIILKEEAPSRAQRVLKNKDILYQTVRPYQKNNYYFNEENFRYPYIASTGYAQIRTNEDSKYLYHFIHTDNFVDDVLERCTGTSYPAINSADLKTMIINFPSLPEQTQIAEFLSSIDSKLELVEKELLGVKEFKKGLLQQMFV